MSSSFIQMPITDINRPLPGLYSPWPKPAADAHVMPKGLLDGYGLASAAPALNHALAVLFCHQMIKSTDLVIDWVLGHVRSFEDRLDPAFGALLRYAAEKAEQQQSYRRLLSDLAHEGARDIPSGSAGVALTPAQYHPLTFLLFVLDHAWGSEWLADCARTSATRTHPALPSILAAERRIDASARTYLRQMVADSVAALSHTEVAAACRDLRRLYRDLERVAACLAAAAVFQAEQQGVSDEARTRLFAQFEAVARGLWSRPSRHLPGYESFLKGLAHGTLLIATTDEPHKPRLVDA